MCGEIRREYAQLFVKLQCDGMQTILFNCGRLTPAIALQCYFKGSATDSINHVRLAGFGAEQEARAGRRTGRRS
jgi:hypothetical protein